MKKLTALILALLMVLAASSALAAFQLNGSDIVDGSTKYGTMGGYF
ncbi:MAG: hypothetical protein Q4C54_05310 [Clostridia bacterium]|nr:hypothetical protein [Clostridia bacterium]